MEEKLARCEKCGCEYPEEWGKCQCVTMAEEEKRRKLSSKKAPK